MNDRVKLVQGKEGRVLRIRCPSCEKWLDMNLELLLGKLSEMKEKETRELTTIQKKAEKTRYRRKNVIL
jgi:hypothetical protein